MASPFLYFIDERLSAAELSAARLDGHLVELGEAYIPADAVETRELRAGSLRRMLGDTMAATHLSAAWVHGAVHEPPARHTVQRAVARRLNRVIDTRVLYRDLEVASEDRVRVGGVWVTSLTRTLADASRVDDVAHQRAARQLVEAFPGLAQDALCWLQSRGPVPYKRAAAIRLRALRDEFTRM